MAETTTEEERKFTIDHGNGATSTIKGRVITTDHGVTDEEGNPKISVHISMDQSVPPLPAVAVTPGEVT
jgi:hypothetical protein